MYLESYLRDPGFPEYYILAIALICAITDLKTGKIYNIGNPKNNFSVRELAHKMLGDVVAGCEMRLDEGHGLFDIGHLAQRVAHACRTLFEPALDIVGQRGVVAFDAGRPQAFQHVEDLLELEEHRRRRAAFQPETAQMFELGHHIDQG
ncbi:MAG: hypothetical protein IH969_06985 [Candidatus Krumholzibacteriota bacterium]|nr:hypothetical protein [Candidatus Krumholzibacteriota bacterium]